VDGSPVVTKVVSTHKPETLARALMRLVAESPINKRASAPIKTGPDAEQARVEYLRARSIVQTIADRGPDYLTPLERRAAIEDLRVRASIDPLALARLASEIDALVDTRMLEMDALMDTWRVALRHPCRDRATRDQCDIGVGGAVCGPAMKGEVHDACLGYPRPKSTLAAPCIIIETSHQPDRAEPESRRTPPTEYGPKPVPTPSRPIYALAPSRRRHNLRADRREVES
jgi:hypothetical protein